MNIQAVKQAAAVLSAALRRAERVNVNAHRIAPFDDVDAALLDQARADAREAMQHLAELTGTNEVPSTVLGTTYRLIQAEQAHAEAIRKADAELATARESHTNAIANALWSEIKRIEIEVQFGRRQPRLNARLADLRVALEQLQRGGNE